MQKDLLSHLYDFNTWWQNENFRFGPENSWPKRETFPVLKKYLKNPQIIALTGLRRIGKTTLIRQLINSLLERNTRPENILYFSFEESEVALRKDLLGEILYSFVEKVREEKIAEVKKRVFVFLDEVQYIPAWQDVLKRFYDFNKNFKFIISGSSSLFIHKNSLESLAGRIFEIKLPPLSFNEFLILKKHPPIEPLSLKEIAQFEDRRTKIEKEMAYAADKMEGLLRQYLTFGQFPEAISLSNWQEYFKSSIWEKVIERDIPRIFRVAKVFELKHLFYGICRESNQLFQASSWAQETGLSLDTLNNYLSFLEKANFIFFSYNFSKGFRKGLRTLRKVFAGSSNFQAAALLLEPHHPMFIEKAGSLLETALATRAYSEFDRVFFWRKGGREIDSIVSLESQIIPIEIKYKKKVERKDYKTLKHHLKASKKGKTGVITTLGEVGAIKEDGITIHKVPVYYLL